LIRRYGSGICAAETFMERATTLSLREIYYPPSLERCQGFYLLSIAQQGSEDRNRSSVCRRLSYASSPQHVSSDSKSLQINLSIAMRMATLMGLHREETYILSNTTNDLRMKAECARRTMVSEPRRIPSSSLGRGIAARLDRKAAY
jgi:hypothetical protein